MKTAIQNYLSEIGRKGGAKSRRTLTPGEDIMKGELSLSRITKDGKTAILVRVNGNVGDENRAKLDALNMTPVSDISNCRQIVTSTPAELDAIRNALVAQGIVNGPSK